jgi:dephospho-CoA kinase
MLNASGELNRPALASLVFGDPASRHRLEAILHPRIQRAWMERLATLEAQGHPLAAVIIPLLYETAVEPEFDAVVCVACSDVEQAARLAARGWSEAESGRRQTAQFSVSEKMQRADFVIWTEGEIEAHRQQLCRVLGRLRDSS